MEQLVQSQILAASKGGASTFDRFQVCFGRGNRREATAKGKVGSQGLADQLGPRPALGSSELVELLRHFRRK